MLTTKEELDLNDLELKIGELLADEKFHQSTGWAKSGKGQVRITLYKESDE